MAEYRTQELQGQMPNLLRDPVPYSTALGDEARRLADRLDKYAAATKEEKDLTLVAEFQRNLGEEEYNRLIAEGAMSETQRAFTLERDLELRELQNTEEIAQSGTDPVIKKAVISEVDRRREEVLQTFNSRLAALDAYGAQLRRGSQQRYVSLYRQFVTDHPTLQGEFAKALNIFQDFRSLTTSLESEADKVQREAYAEIQKQAILQGTTPDVILYRASQAQRTAARKQELENAQMTGQLNRAVLTRGITESATDLLGDVLYGEDGVATYVNALVSGELANPADALQAISRARMAFNLAFNDEVVEIQNTAREAGEEFVMDVEGIRRGALDELKAYEDMINGGSYEKLKRTLEENISDGLLGRIGKYMYGITDPNVKEFVATMRSSGQTSKVVNAYLTARETATEALATLTNLKDIGKIKAVWGLGGATSSPDMAMAMDYVQSQFVQLEDPLKIGIAQQLMDERATNNFVNWIRGLYDIPDTELQKYSPAWLYLINTVGAARVIDPNDPNGQETAAGRTGELIGAITFNPSNATALSNPDSSFYRSDSFADVKNDPRATDSTVDRLNAIANQAWVLNDNNASLAAITFDPNSPMGFSFKPFQVTSFSRTGNVREPYSETISSQEKYDERFNGVLAKLQSAYTFTVKTKGKVIADNMALIQYNGIQQKLERPTMQTAAQEAVSQPTQAAPQQQQQSQEQERVYSWDELE